MPTPGMNTVVLLQTHYYTCSIIINDKDEIIDAAPVLRWVEGQNATWFKNIMIRRGILQKWEIIKKEPANGTSTK